MKAKSFTLLAAKILVLTVLLFFITSAAAVLAGMGKFVQVPDPTAAAMASLMVSFLQALVLSYAILRSRWTGWRLVLTIFFVFYGATTFMSQIETVVFLRYLVDVVPAAMIPGLFLQGAITAAVFAPLAVWFLGKMKEAPQVEGAESEAGLPGGEAGSRPWREWVGRWALIALLYVMVYIGFGALVFRPLAGPAFEAYYGDLQLPGWIIPFQLLRGLMWGALALPVVRMTRGRWWEPRLLVALLFSVLMAANLLIPTEIMPPVIRKAHLVEVFSSNFLFGWATAWLLTGRRGLRQEG